MLERVIAQDKAVKFLHRILVAGRTAHAYIFCGPRGVGKRTAAEAFIAGHVCTSPNEGRACGCCASCTQVFKASYPNLYVLEPEKDAIRIAQTRHIQEMLKFKVEQASMRFILVDRAHLMTPEAANSLLRLLEDPPPRTCFILIVDNLNMVLSTVVSRCQVIGFNRLPASSIRNILLARGYSEEDTAAVIPLASGSIGRAIELLENEDVSFRRDKIISLLKDLPVNWDRLLDFLQESGTWKDTALDLETILAFYRDRLVWETVGNEKMVIDGRLLDVFKDSSNDSTSGAVRGRRKEWLLFCLHKTIQAQESLSKNANANLVLETLFLNLNEGLLEEGFQ